MGQQDIDLTHPSDLTQRADIQQCTQNAARADFFALVALLEQLIDAPGRVGTEAFPSAEGVRFSHSEELGFSAADICDASVNEKRVDIKTTFLGLSGAVSPLPLYVVEDALDDTKDSSVGDFLDLFHHRAISLLYRSVIRQRLDIMLSSQATDVWSNRLLALGGMDGYESDASQTANQNPSNTRTASRGRSLYLQLLPLLAGRDKSAAALERALMQVLKHAFSYDSNEPLEKRESLSVTVQEWVGDRIAVDESQQLRLGKKDIQLGRTARLGRKQFDPAARFEVKIGPLRTHQYHRCMRGDLAPMIQEAIHMFCPFGVKFRVAFAVSERDASLFGASLSGTPLGHTTWLQGKAASRIIYQPQTITHNQGHFAI